MRIGAEKARVMEALEGCAAARQGAGECVCAGRRRGGVALFADLHCAACDITYSDPHPSSFSFNNPLGACGPAVASGGVIGVDLGLAVIPDEGKRWPKARSNRGETAASRNAGTI